jgi:hypothetical protein
MFMHYVWYSVVSGGRREKFWGISCEKSRFYAKKSYFFQFFHFLQYFRYIVVVNFMVGGNRSTRRKPQTCHKSLTNFIT